jgi:hypothetical protein
MTTDRRTAGPDFLAENWGRWIFVFDRGRYAITQENHDACTWGYGKFTVDSSPNRLRIMFTDGGGIAPNGAMNRLGESFVFGWSAFHDTLTVTPVKGASSPSNFRARPWRRLATKPSPRFLSHRCPPPTQALGD